MTHFLPDAMAHTPHSSRRQEDAHRNRAHESCSLAMATALAVVLCPWRCPGDFVASSFLLMALSVIDGNGRWETLDFL